MNTSVNPRHFFFGALIIALGLSIAIFLPFLSIIILAGSCAVVMYPLFMRLKKWMRSKSGAVPALVTVLTFAVLVCAPLVLLGIVVFNQSSALYASLVSKGTYSSYMGTFDAIARQYVPSGIALDIEGKVAELAANVSANIAHLFTATLSTLFSFLLLLLSLFYFLKDGDHWKQAAILLSPLPDTDDERVLVRLRDAIRGVVQGYLLIALVQGILMGIGLALFGVPNAALLGVVAGIASLVPSVGTALVSVPLVCYLFFSGDVHGAIGMAIWASVLVGMVDNLLSPVLVGRRLKMPPFAVLFSVLGGVSLLGPAGILIGPLVISLLYALVSIYKDERTA
jgi:predicted PurR-regulated permease PerM